MSSTIALTLSSKNKESACNGVTAPNSWLRFLSKCLSVPAFKKMVGIIHDETVSYLDEVWKDKGSLDFYSDVGEMIIRTSTQ